MFNSVDFKFLVCIGFMVVLLVCPSVGVGLMLQLGVVGLLLLPMLYIGWWFCVFYLVWFSLAVFVLWFVWLVFAVDLVCVVCVLSSCVLSFGYLAFCVCVLLVWICRYCVGAGG